MHLSANTQSLWLDSLRATIFGALELVAEDTKTRYYRIVNRMGLEAARILETQLSYEHAKQILGRVSRSSLKDADIWDEILQGITHQVKSLGIPLLVDYINYTNSTKQPVMYAYLQKLIPVAAETTGYARSVSLLIVSIRKLLEQDEKRQLEKPVWKLFDQSSGSLVNTLLYTLKHLLYQLEDKSPSELVKSVEELIVSKVLLWSNHSSQNNASKVLEFCIKEALKHNLSATFDAILETIDKMHPKPLEIFFNKVLDYMVKHSVSIKYSEQLLSVMIKNRVKASLITFNTLLDMYVSQKNFQMVDYLFSSLCTSNDPVPDNFTFSIMISSVKYRTPRKVDKALELFDLYKERLPVDLVIVNCLLDVLASLGEQDLVNQLLEESKTVYNLTMDHVSYNTLIKDCAKRGDLQLAEDLFNNMLSQEIKPSKITFNSLMDICVKAKNFNRAMHYLGKMKASGIQPDQFSYSIVFTGIKNSIKDDSVYKQTFACLESLMGEEGFAPDEIFFNTMMDVTVKFKDLEKTISLFKKMLELEIQPSSVSYGILIKAYGKAGLASKAEEVFFEMKTGGIEPNDVTYGCLIEAYLAGDELAKAEELFNQLPELQVKINPVLLSTMIKGYSRKYAYSQAISLFDRTIASTDGFKPNLVCFNCIIDVASRKRNLPLAYHYLDMLPQFNLAPDMITYSILIKGLCLEKSCSKAAQILQKMIDEHISPDLTIFNLILESCADPQEAKTGIQVLKTLLSMQDCKPNQVSFGIAAKLYGFVNQVDEAFGLLKRMKNFDVAPSVIFFTNLIHICFSNSEVKKAKEAFELMQEYNITPDQICWNKYILGLTRNRDVESAVEELKKATEVGIEVRSDILEKMVEKLSRMGKRFISQLNMVRKLLSKAKIQDTQPSKYQSTVDTRFQTHDTVHRTHTKPRSKGTFGAELSTNFTPTSSGHFQKENAQEHTKAVVNKFSCTPISYLACTSVKATVPVIVGDPKEIQHMAPKSAEKPIFEARTATDCQIVQPTTKPDGPGVVVRKSKLKTSSKDFFYPSSENDASAANVHNQQAPWTQVPADKTSHHVHFGPSQPPRPSLLR